MKIPVAAGPRLNWVPPQISPLNSLDDKSGNQLTDELTDTFNVLSLSASNDSLKTADPLTILAPSQYDAVTRSRNAKSDSESESDSEDESSSSSDEKGEDDEDLISKGPGREPKKARDVRLQNAPYQRDILNRALHSGGNIISNGSYSNWDYQAPSLNDSDSIDSWKHVVDDIQSNLTPDQLKVLYEAIDLYTVEDMEKFAKAAECASRSDEDSDYGTSSPHSSIHEPNSPLPEFESSSTPGIIPSWGERSSCTLYITEARNIPAQRNQGRCPTLLVQSESQPMTSTPRTIAPEPVVYETGMKQPATQRIQDSLNKKQLGIEWIKVLQDKEFINLKDQNNETKFMAHLRKRNSPMFKEILHAMLERIRKEKFSDLLQHKNHNDHSALSIAVDELKDDGLIARYVLEVLCEFGYDPEEVDSKGNTWLHRLADRGDEYVQVLAEFLNMETKEGFKFDVNKKNFYLDTPIHIAARKHSQSFSTLAVTKLLIKHHSDISLKNQDGLTPVHLAVQQSCNSQLIKAILSSNYADRASYIADLAGETALHYAAKRNDLLQRHQWEVFVQLISSQWQLRARDHSHKVPLDYFDDQRRKIFQELLTKK